MTNIFPAIESLRAAISEIEKSAELELHDQHAIGDDTSPDFALESILKEVIMTEDLELRPHDSAALINLLISINS